MISLENWLRNKLQETEENLYYEIATDTLRCWIDEYKDYKKQIELDAETLIDVWH